MSEILTASTARSHGASCTEDVLQTICDGCAKANLDFSEPDFCPIQTNYGWAGEDEHIVYKDKRGEFDAWCTEYEEADA